MTMTFIPEEEVCANIEDMGYIMVTAKRSYPSYYKLLEGTIIKIEVLINYIVPDPRQPQGLNINSLNIISSFVSKEKRRPEAFASYSQEELNKGVIDEDVEFEVLRENFSTYELSNDFILSVKPVLAQVKKTKFYSVNGEPIFIVNFNPIMKLKKK